MGDVFELPFEVSSNFSGNGTTCGFNNNYTRYGDIKVVESGPEVVYSFTMASAGPIQITLAGLSADLDLYLCNGPSSEYCVAHSINSGTSDEQVDVEAEAGTYYLVVDGYNGACSAYQLVISNPIEGDTYELPFVVQPNYSGNGTMCGFTNNYQTYSCLEKVLENGPEVVYSFTTTSAGPITVALTGLSSDLDLFLCNGPSENACVAASAFGGIHDEEIEYSGPAGTYYVMVDGYEGVCGTFDINVTSSASPTSTPTSMPTVTPTSMPAPTDTPTITPTPTHTPVSSTATPTMTPIPPTATPTMTPGFPTVTPTATTTPVPVSFKVNFQSDLSERPEGWLEDNGYRYGPKPTPSYEDLGYGWQY